jgi:hypothetical protein
MGIGLGIGINRSNYAQGIFNAYQSRVIADGGVTEAGACVDAVSGLLLTASLLLIPSGYKSGKAYAQIPTNGNGDLTWTRASDAWRTNAEGLIQRVPWNLVTYSEDFSNAAWLKQSGVSVTANQTISPDGTQNADLVVGNGTNGIYQFGKTVSTTVANTKSVYLRGVSGGEVVRLQDPSQTIGFTTCTLTTSWQRFTLSEVQSGGVAGLWVTNIPSGGIFIWGAQLVEGSSAQTYFPTTDRLNVPRLSYMYGSCPALLLEPQRTNLCLYSEQFSDVTWGKIFSSITANSTTSPDGNTTADTFTADGSNNQHYVVGSTSGTVTSGSSSSYTIYAKKNTNNFIQLWISNTFGGMFANFDLNNGVVGTLGTGGTGSNPTSSITSVGNGWYRCSMTFVPTTTGVVGSLVAMTSSASAVRAEANTLSTSVYLWGAQLEVGAYPTTYIPTTTASATRVADSFSRNNIYTNGLITSSGGTWFVELRGNLSLTRDSFADGLQLTNTAITDRFTFTFGAGSPATGLVTIRKAVGGTLTSLYTTTTSTTKIAIKWNGSTADIFVNGTKQVSATAFTATQLENLTSTGADTPKFIQAMALYPTPLSDTDCTTLTTL